jgi:hypothetical protein
MHYTVIGESDGLGYIQSPVVGTLAEAATIYCGFGNQVYVCDENGSALRALTEAEESELRALRKSLQQNDVP